MIRTFLFDLGNVLVSFCHDRMCRQLAAVCDTDESSMRHVLFEEGLLAALERGQITETDLHRKLEARFDRTLHLDDLLRAGSDIFSLNESIVPIIEGLKSQGYRLVLLSNTSISHLNWVRREWTILDAFDHLVTSYEAGATKPDPAIFEAALTAAECAATECFYTDDVPAYVTAARGFGIDAEVYIDTPSLIAQLTERGITISTAGERGASAP